MFKVIADVIEFDGYIVGTIGDIPATVKGRLIEALEDYTEECDECKEYEDVIDDLNNEADKLATMLTEVEGERDRYKAILGLTS